MDQQHPTTPAGVSLTQDLVTGRECGDCAVCCTLFHVPALQKPANMPCVHGTGIGCSIHATRPDICRDYFCLWRRVEALPDTARPDRLGIVFSLVKGYAPVSRFEGLHVITRAVGDAAIFDTPSARAAIDMFVTEGSLPVFTAFGNERTRVYPDPALDPAGHAQLCTDPDARHDYEAVNVNAPAESSDTS